MSDKHAHFKYLPVEKRKAQSLIAAATFQARTRDAFVGSPVFLVLPFDRRDFFVARGAGESSGPVVCVRANHHTY